MKPQVMNKTLIYMPVFNEERHLSLTIKSILNQTHSDFHLLISNNNSTDRSDEIIELYLTDGRITKITPNTHLSSIEHSLWIDDYISMNFNYCEYTIFVGGHDLWSAEYLKTLIDGMNENPNAAVVYTDTFELDDSSKVIKKYDGYIVTTGVTKPLKPLHVLTGLSHNIIFGGIWRQSVKSRIKIRHKCMGVDHFLIAEASLLGDIVYRYGGKIGLRRVEGAGDWSIYIKKHFGLNEISSEDGLKDFENQLEWVISLQERAIKGDKFYEHPTIFNSLLIAIINCYISRYWSHLSAFGAIEKFLNLTTINKSNDLINQTIAQYRIYVSEIVIGQNTLTDDGEISS